MAVVLILTNSASLTGEKARSDLRTVMKLEGDQHYTVDAAHRNACQIAIALCNELLADARGC